jgi:drug/metabolite transporter (DMT)-like permease
MLVLVTALWGVSFTWTKSWQEAARGSSGGELLSSVTLIGVRMSLGLVLLGLWRPRVLLAPTRREHMAGVFLGVVQFAGFSLQTWGLAWTTPALSGFFTSLCSAWVPLIAFVVLRERVAPLTLFGLILAILGCSVLVEGWRLGQGEWLTVIASLLFAAQLLLLDRFGKAFEPAHFTASYFVTNAVLALLFGLGLATRGCGVDVWFSWATEMLTTREVAMAVACQTIFATVLTFHWMNVYQPRISAPRAALVYMLEPIFSSTFSILWGYDHVTWALLVGGVLVLGGNLLVELPRLLPLWRRG